MQRPHRSVRAVAVLALALAGITCGEPGSTGPGIPSVVSLSLAPHLAVAAGAPTVRMTRARAVARRLPSGFVALDTVATFPTTGDELSLDLRVPMLAPNETFELLLRGIAANGDTVYAAVDTVELRQGATPGEPVSLPLSYVGPDTIVASIAIAPRDTTFRSTDTVTMRAVARKQNGDIVPTALVGWESREPLKFEINATTGRLVAKGTFSGVWIVGATANGRFDSTRVSSIPPVASVTIDVATPGEQTVVRGDTRRFTATLRGPGGELITGRPIAWSADRPLGGTVDGTGLFTALRADSVVTLTATSEGKSGSVVVRVGRKGVARVDLSAALDSVLPGGSRAYTAEAYDSAGVVNADHPILWASLDPAVATVAATATGRGATVTAVALGSTIIRATSGAGTASAQKDLAFVVHFPLDSLVASPRLDTLVAIGDVQAHSATGFRGTTPVPGLAVTWSSRAAGVATVDAAGNVTAVANGATWIDVVESTSGFSRRDSVRVVVDQRIASLRFTPDSVVRYVTTHERVAVAAADRRGNPMGAPLLAWSTKSDGAIARVDSVKAGEAFFTAVAVGTDTIIARHAATGTEARTAFRVRPLLTRIELRPADTTLTALRDRVYLTAIGHDSLDAVMEGLTFTFATSAPSIVALDTVHATEAQVLAVANGVSTITASSQGVSGSTRVTVTQTADHIHVTPPSASLPVGGRVRLVAQIRDRNGNPMPGSTFTWESDVPEVASVEVGTGEVTALGPGVAQITARAGALVSAPIPITVSGLELRFSADTVVMAPRRVRRP